ncbi:regulator of telomere elongation helicase 1 [Thalassophryne amazonica]|uniref:regulator of telomere elongation helicase 1 n=1 Tax=Thalassophryne amazonica TaxID=390379 RepID=UPI001471DF76|nr:regulator of telomere elongation helicase 1 [Thalassophryne amazonica]
MDKRWRVTGLRGPHYFHRDPPPITEVKPASVCPCLFQKVNAVLESPTGTGKTLCLLCSSLAWREHFKDTISARKIADRLKGEEMFTNTTLASWGTAVTDGETPIYYTDVPKIIYASRTHSQLTQVISELKNTAYRPKVCVLGSREQLCINPEVMRQESNHVKVHMCRAKVSTRSCIYYNNVEEKSSDGDLMNSILDVEDLVKYGNTHRTCPYYLSRNMKQQADIIFMPYNYLLDPKSRRAHNIDLQGSVIIFDEAHNLEKMCEESTSFDLTPYDLASAITAVDRLLVEQAKETSQGDCLTEDDAVGTFGLKLNVTSIAKVKQILLDLEAAIDSYDVPSDRGITKPGSFIYELLEKAHLTYSTKAMFYEALEEITGYLAGRSGIFVNTSGLQKLADIIQQVFCGEAQGNDKGKQMVSSAAHFKVHIHRDNSYYKKKANADVWASSAKKPGNILSYWCFSPGFSMQDLVGQGVRSIILTSGTLSPLSSFTSEMRISFPVRLENSHVIERDQIFVGVIDRGPDGVLLSSAFDRRFVPENMASLGNTVANLSRVVPHGLLVFFPSFPLMEKTLQFWKENGHADRIENTKSIFVEPKGKGTFTEVIDGYYTKVSDPTSKGGTFFAVCRGKASEGLDFADVFGRGVIITGLPFPPKMDPKVILKMQFLDEMRGKKIPGEQYLTGQEWYRQQAYRAVNQAIGRVIRHKEDFGAIFLCDQRFKAADVRSHLPSWVKPYMKHYDSFGSLVRDVTKFFRVAQKLRPFIEKKPAAESWAAMSSVEAQLSGVASCWSSQSSGTQKAKELDAHIPSLKRRRLNEIGKSNAMAGICIEYESEVQESHRKPATLLNALDSTDHQRADERDGATGETKVTRFSTLSLQYDKRIDDGLRGGKRKIKVVQQEQHQTSDNVCEEGKANRAKEFLAEMKKSLSQVTFNRIVQALQNYKRTDDLDVLLTETVVLSEDTNTHGLLRGFYQFVRPHHKKRFDEQCLELTGQGCGYKPDHSLSKEEKNTLMLQAALNRQAAEAVSSSREPCTETQLSTQELNKGGRHLSLDGLREPQSGCVRQAAQTQIHTVFLADVKKSLGAEKCARLFQAVHGYKRTEDYEQLVGTVVSLLTERNEDFGLLVRFGTFIRPHHKKQYKQMLSDLAGESDQQRPGAAPPPSSPST